MKNTKKNPSHFFLALLICFIFYNCKEQKAQTPEDQSSKAKETIKAPNEIIDIDIARKQYLTYEKRRVNLIQKYEDSVDYYSKDKKKQAQKKPNSNRFNVARYVSWDYATIKNYLKYIEKEAKAADIDINSLRFYFSNYSENDKSAIHPRQNSIMITPTLKIDNKEYIFAIGDNNKPLLLNNEFGLLDTIKNSTGRSNNEQEDKSYASFFPNTTNLVPIYAEKSVTMNKGNSHP